ncbi:PEGA domain-containing protein [Gemmata sp. G18]|uniref:PEGA domain-containing protein n=1 Tax=Gemmata palustris TaxID=2822762 RepID=A0ABS5BNL4_9BACT|nr:PEGA domain-containing protein [Gemmata palustris]MBP3955279.1 PEGA domain-containing protein [Gemmata palustris]
MTTGRTVRLAAVLAGLTAAGCVDRRFVIESNVPNAQVYIDNKSIGAAPAHAPYEYYGYYTIKVVQPGYETIEERVHVRAPWYAYPPIDFLAEVVWPFHIRDTRRYYFKLTEATQARGDDILMKAEELRQRGMTLPQAERPAEPRPPKPKPAALPPGAPVPDAVPSVVPSVTP